MVATVFITIKQMKKLRNVTKIVPAKVVMGKYDVITVAIIDNKMLCIKYIEKASGITGTLS